jgi:SET domain-containing protein
VKVISLGKSLKKNNANNAAIAAPEADYLYVAQSLIAEAGQGLFTAIPIFKDEVICLYGGETIGPNEAKKRAAKKQNQYFINLPNGKILDSIASTCFARYANDAGGKQLSTAKNNAKIALNENGKVCLISRKKIKAGEEIYCSYGPTYWLS